MVYIVGIFQLVVLAGICLYEFRHKSAAVFMWATVLVMFGIMHMLASFTGDPQYSDMVLIEASVFVIIFSLIYFFMRILLANKVLKKNQMYFTYGNMADFFRENSVKDGRWLIILLIVVFTKIYPYMKSVKGILLTSWGSKYAYDSSLSYVNTSSIESIVFFSLSGLTVIYCLEKRYKLMGITIVTLVMNVILTRNRIEILPLICSILLLFIMKNKRIRPKTVIIAMISAIGIIYIVYGIRVFRHYGTLQTFINEFELMDFIQRINEYIRTDDGELGLRRYFYYFIARDNRFPNFGRGHSYIRMLLVYLPSRWSLGIKPNDFAVSMGRAVGMKEGVSIHPTLFGDCYANLAEAGVFLGIFWALYVTFNDKLICKQKSTTAMLLMYVLNAVAYVIIGRGSVYNGFWYVAYGVPVIWLSDFILNKCKKIKFVVK